MSGNNNRLYLAAAASILGLCAVSAHADPNGNVATTAQHISTKTDDLSGGGMNEPSLEYHIPYLEWSGNQRIIKREGNDRPQIVYGNELSIVTDRILDGYKTLDDGSIEYFLHAEGNTKITELTAHIQADRVDLVLPKSKSDQYIDIKSADIYRYPYYIKTNQLRISENSVDSQKLYFTTSNNSKSPAYTIVCSDVTYNPVTKQGIAQNATLYVFGAKIITLRKYRFKTSRSALSGQQNRIKPMYGNSSRLGNFVSVNFPCYKPFSMNLFVLIPTKQSIEASFVSSQPIPVKGLQRHEEVAYTPPKKSLLESVRSIAVGDNLLPEDDPLMFQPLGQFTQSIRPLEPHANGGLALNEIVSSNISSSGHLRDDLYVSRLPEVGIGLVYPLRPVPAIPMVKGADVYRRYLKQTVPYINLGVGAGNFYEKPTNIHGNRTQIGGMLYTSPIMISNNMFIIPRLSSLLSHYNKSTNTYRYSQVSLSYTLFINKLSAFGFDYYKNFTSGNSPFNFDALDTSQEIDPCIQLGNRKGVIGGSVRYDIDGHKIIDYKLTVGPNIRGFMPLFSYNFRNRSVNVGAELEGITF